MFFKSAIKLVELYGAVEKRFHKKLLILFAKRFETSPTDSVHTKSSGTLGRVNIS